MRKKSQLATSIHFVSCCFIPAWYVTFTLHAAHHLPIHTTINAGNACVAFWLEVLEYCPLDWRATILWKVVPASQHNHINQGCWKKAWTALHCIVVLQSRGQGSKKMDNYRTIMSPTFYKNKDLVTNTLKRWSGIFPTTLIYVVLLENCQNNIWLIGCSPIPWTRL